MCLLTAGYEDIEELRDITDEELLEIRNLNVKGVTEIRAAIEAYFIEEEDESEKDLEDEFKDITIFQRDENIGVTVDFVASNLMQFLRVLPSVYGLVINLRIHMIFGSKICI